MNLDNLPAEWKKIEISEICDPKQYKTIPISELTEDGFVVYGANGVIGKYSKFTHEKSTLMITCRGATCGNLHISQPYSYINGNAMALDNVSGHINLRYLYFCLKARGLEDVISGSAQPQITRQNLVNAEIIITSLEEQQEIVRQLDVMLAQVEQIKARLDAIPAILKKFRQSVLADAVSGKLTEEWREGADFDIEAWTYERAEDLCLKVQSGSTPRNNPFDQNGTIPFLKVYNIVDQKISFDYKPQFILEDVHQNGSKRSICKPFDVLMNIVGPPLGKIAIVTDQYPEWNINQAITMFRVNPEKLTYKFLYYVLCEGQIVRDVLHETKGSVGQINISLSQCRDALIPKPSLIEQDAIVETIDSLLGMAEKIENTVQLAQKRVNLLTQSILAKAFSGELTAEWREQHQELITGANSVESLLAKIQAEREVSKPVKKVKKVK